MAESGLLRGEDCSVPWSHVEYRDVMEGCGRENVSHPDRCVPLVNVSHPYGCVPPVSVSHPDGCVPPVNVSHPYGCVPPVSVSHSDEYVAPANATTFDPDLYAYPVSVRSAYADVDGDLDHRKVFESEIEGDDDGHRDHIFLRNERVENVQRNSDRQGSNHDHIREESNHDHVDDRMNHDPSDHMGRGDNTTLVRNRDVKGSESRHGSVSCVFEGLPRRLAGVVERYEGAIVEPLLTGHVRELEMAISRTHADH